MTLKNPKKKNLKRKRKREKRNRKRAKKQPKNRIKNSLKITEIHCNNSKKLIKIKKIFKSLLTIRKNKLYLRKYEVSR